MSVTLQLIVMVKVVFFSDWGSSLSEDRQGMGSTELQRQPTSFHI